MKKITLLVTVIAVVGFQHAFSASVVFGNLGADGSGGLSVNGTSLSNINWSAQGFSTGTSSLLTVSTITLGLNFLAPTNAVLKLYSDNSGQPGAEIKSVSVGVSSGSQKVQFVLNELLAAGTDYWVVFGADNASWVYADPEAAPAEQNASGYSYLGNKFTLDGGATWGTDFAPQEAISVEAVPEPSTYVLLATSAMGFGCYALRRRR